MIEWILYCLSISALLAVAAFAAERALGHYRRPVRWAWAGALAGSLLFPLAAWLVPQVLQEVSGSLPARPVSLEALAALGIGAGPSGAEPSASLASLRAVLLGLWAASVLGVGGWIGISWWRLRREMRGWTPGRVLGAPVLLSPDRGPAVVGVGRGVIVLPRWIAGLRDDLLRLVFLHEQEHREAGDQRLFAAALLGLVAMPWNPVLWWQLRRLRLAIEYDCDRRVLSRGVSPRAYGEALLTVGGRIGRLPLAAAAFAERRSAVERRLRRLSEPLGALRGPRAATAALIALGAIALACESPPPVDPSDAPIADALPSQSSAPPAPARIQELDDSSQRPALIPYDVPPTLRNRSEVVQLLERFYPRSLKDAGVGGRVELWMYVTERGTVERSEVKTSSGDVQLDQAAQRIAGQMRFEPALNRDDPTPVWVSQWITFDASGPRDAEGTPAGPPSPEDVARGTSRTDRLVVIDGVVQSDRAALDALDPSRIESIEIVKGKAAVALYGDRAGDGVIQIRTKASASAGAAPGPSDPRVGAPTLAPRPRETARIGRGEGVRIAGTSAIGDEPLIVVDGVVQEDAVRLEQLQALDIEKIEVIKGEAARAAYGDAGRDGVVLITTKSGGS